MIIIIAVQLLVLYLISKTPDQKNKYRLYYSQIIIALTIVVWLALSTEFHYKFNNQNNPVISNDQNEMTTEIENQNAEMVKVHIDLPNHWAIGGESMWATPLGNDLYRLENVPFYAYGLNYHDVVRATADSEELKPEVRELVETSGHRTFRIYFEKTTDKEKHNDILNSLKDFALSFEQANDIYYALDMEPEGDYNAAYDRLDDLEQEGILGFETCEAKAEGSFDDLPEDSE